MVRLSKSLSRAHINISEQVFLRKMLGTESGPLNALKKILYQNLNFICKDLKYSADQARNQGWGNRSIAPSNFE